LSIASDSVEPKSPCSPAGELEGEESGLDKDEFETPVCPGNHGVILEKLLINFLPYRYG